MPPDYMLAALLVLIERLGGTVTITADELGAANEYRALQVFEGGGQVRFEIVDIPVEDVLQN